MKILKMLMVLLITSVTEVTATNNESICFGQTHNGSISKSVQLPLMGRNYRAFSELAWYLGRTFVHSKVNDVILDSYKKLAQQMPSKGFMYAETGWPEGGDFNPHRTHQNGLSVDFMVPVMDQLKKSVLLPISALNKWGYAIEFDHHGVYENFEIDFDAMSLHIKTMYEISKSHGFGIKHIYFDPRMQQKLFESKYGPFLKHNISFNSKKAWVRHDEHFHVEFALECKNTDK